MKVTEKTRQGKNSSFSF